ncbi:hypothetical protein CDV55_104285 [Aspergillus turcosus]|nr:hypothetical protein CDV55_104285 [Aspergillus turcosus]
MHLTAALSFALITLAAPVLCALPSACTSTSDFIPDKLDTVFQTFDEHVCKEGCKTTMSQFETWVNGKIVSEVVKASMDKMGLSSFVSLADTISGAITKKIEEQCAAAGGQADPCQDHKAMQAVEDCLKENMMPAVLGEMDQYSAFITKSMCEKVNAYLKGPELWESVIPQEFDVYASTCEKI